MAAHPPPYNPLPPRPSLLTPGTRAEILARLAAGQTLLRICRDAHMPDRTTVVKWVSSDRDGFAAEYRAAREHGYEVMAEELLDIADDGRNDYLLDPETGKQVWNGEHPFRSRLRLDTRKWILAKMLPKVFGDKQQVEHSGGVNVVRVQRGDKPAEGGKDAGPDRPA